MVFCMCLAHPELAGIMLVTVAIMVSANHFRHNSVVIYYVTQKHQCTVCCTAKEAEHIDR